VKSIDELNAERGEKAREVFTPTQIHNWEGQARRDAEAGTYGPPSTAGDIALLADSVYILAWSRRRYKLSRAKRDEDAKLLPQGQR
jgi:hypothetical protein